MSRIGRTLWVVLAAALASAPVHGRADDLERARELFQAGLDDMLAGRFETGCPNLAESYRLSDLPGALFTLAECEAKWGKLASAQAHYRTYLARYVGLSPQDRGRQAERKTIAAGQVEALEGTVPRLTLVLPEGAAAPVFVERDGERLASPTFGVSTAIDPGEHRVVAHWSGGTTRQYVRTLGPGERAEILLEPPPASGSAGGAGGAGGDAPAGGSSDGSNGSALVTAGYVVGAVGVAGLITGAVTGGLAVGAKQGVEDHCVETVCTPEGKDAADETKALGNASTATFVIGGAAVVVGVILLLVAPDDDASASASPSESAQSAVSLRPVAFGLPGAGASAMAGLQARW